MNTEVLSNLVISKILCAATFYNDVGGTVKRENRDRWAIVLKYEGETVYTVNGRQYVSNINNAVILPKGCSYQWQCTKKGHFAVVEFESECTCSDIIYFRSVDGAGFLRLFKEIEYKHTAKKYMYKAECLRDAYSIILKLCDTSAKKYLPSEKAEKIAIATEYIAKHYTDNITNDMLAQLTGFSTVYFRKLFTAVYGTSPIQYIQKLRIKKAREMLESDYGTITDIALSLGYLNIYDFSRSFKKHTGICPTDYVKSIQH